ncbi:hypothetical protein F2P79_008413 [Pimephales promelas]|nr:hypothetical protein F2P79_008413 [Pimephales promelas]
MWNNWGETSRESVYERVGVQTIPSDDPQDDDEVVTEVAAKADHDYAVTPLPGAQDAAAARIQDLEAEVRRLERLKEKVLADIFKVSVSTVSRIIITWASYLYLVLGSLPIWMSREQVKATMPEKFRQFCPEVRVIIDCTEIRCQNPSSLTLQSEVFSSYKNTTTFKGLIGIAPCGAVTFVSSLYTGSISDQELTKQSGILDLLEPGDACMADKGFTMEKMLAERGAKLIIPPFKTAAQFSKENAERTQAIARLRILVERAIRRVKEFHIWDTTVPLTLSGTVNQLWTNCCLMSNFQWPLDVKGHKGVCTS